MLRPSVRAASAPKPRPKALRNQNVRRRVVTQQNFFLPVASLCADLENLRGDT
jgi:hypothetical protein